MGLRVLRPLGKWVVGFLGLWVSGPKCGVGSSGPWVSGSLGFWVFGSLGLSGLDFWVFVGRWVSGSLGLNA